MNSRIFELLEQSGFDVKRLIQPYPGGFPREDLLALESFAELVVLDCISRIKEVQDIQTQINPGSEYLEGFDDGMFVCIRTLEEHFGVTNEN